MLIRQNMPNILKCFLSLNIGETQTYDLTKGIVARNVFKLEFSDLHNFSCSMVEASFIGDIFERISIFHHVV